MIIHSSRSTTTSRGIHRRIWMILASIGMFFLVGLQVSRFLQWGRSLEQQKGNDKLIEYANLPLQLGSTTTTTTSSRSRQRQRSQRIENETPQQQPPPKRLDPATQRQAEIANNRRRRRRGERIYGRADWVLRRYNATATEEFATALETGRLVPANPNATDLQGGHHALLVTYRERPYHLIEFVKFMTVYLSYQFTNGTFTLWVIEQDDHEPFNRAWLANVGLQQIVARPQSPTICITLHDVDMVPLWEVKIPYDNCSAVPLQLAQAKMNGRPHYMGGVTVLSLAQWQQINGMSNDYVGWGMEDDDLYHRLRLNGFLSPIVKKNAPVPWTPPLSQRQFQLISQTQHHHHTAHKEHSGDNNNWNHSKALLQAMQHNSSRWQTDGLNNLQYRITRETIVSNNILNSAAGIDAIHHIKVVAAGQDNNPKETKHDIEEIAMEVYFSRLQQQLERVKEAPQKTHSK